MTSELATRIGDRRLLVAGIRPEHFEDATLLDEAKRAKGISFEAPVDVTEWLGSEQFAFIPYQAPPEIRAQLAELARELDSEQLRTQLVASLDPMSRVLPGERAQLWVNPARMHLFDPRTGDNLTRPGTDGQVPVAATSDRADVGSS